MASYWRKTRHPSTGTMELAEWIKNYYGYRISGVRFQGSPTVYHELAHTWEFGGPQEDPPEPEPQPTTEDRDND